ncbi:MAG: hypothetical protein KKC55_12295 [Gammaproteobacteria bacterium]|jgi:hypothetical protein|nr:hypothetical protein [Gammaproteobacteria bacterium]
MTHIHRPLRAGVLGALLIGITGLASAQDEGPAVQTSNVGAEQPAPPAAAAAAAEGEGSGTVIIGDRESPIGLYIMPWRDSSAAADMDRPARLVKASLLPIDRPVFLRELQYHRALTGALAERNQVTPDVPLNTP